MTVSTGGSIRGIVAYLQQNKTNRTASQPKQTRIHSKPLNSHKKGPSRPKQELLRTHTQNAIAGPEGDTRAIAPARGWRRVFLSFFRKRAAEDSQRGVGRQRRPSAARDLICPQNISGGELLGHRSFVQALCGAQADVAGQHTMRVMPPDTPTADDTRD